MKELCYPFDSALILKKKKKLKRLLLSDGSTRLKKKIAVLGGSTTADIITILELFLLDNGIEPEFYESEYAQYWQDAVFGNEELDNFQPDLVYIHTTSRNINEKVNPTLSKEQAKEILEREFEHLKSAWESLDKKFGCPIIQNNFELPAYRLLGNRDAWDSRGMVNFITRLNVKLYDYAESRENFYINDINYISASFGLDNWNTFQQWYMYKYAMTLDAVPEFSFNIANIVKSIFGKNKKALALDLDNTLWGGVVGDDGVDGIEIGEETPNGQAFREFQSYIKEHKNIGVMLTVCSKNEEENAIAGLNHPDCVLKPDDFVNIKANWENKDININNTASEMSIFPDAFVFLDDNPAERAIVSHQIHGIAVPEMEGVENYIRTVDRNGFFEVTNFSDDDLNRNKMYAANAMRAKSVNSFENYTEYLLSLNMKAEICDFKPMYLQRITQLTNKSNQFNLTTKRYTTAEMEQTVQDSNNIRLCGRLEDKFGDNGIVSVVIGHKELDTVHIDLWLMSCRVLKRDMELAMLDKLVEKSVAAGARKIRGYYYKTAKNKMVNQLFEIFGFEKIQTNGEDTIWELRLDGYKNKNNVIELNVT